MSNPYRIQMYNPYLVGDCPLKSPCLFSLVKHCRQVDGASFGPSLGVMWRWEGLTGKKSEGQSWKIYGEHMGKAVSVKVPSGRHTKSY